MKRSFKQPVWRICWFSEARSLPREDQAAFSDIKLVGTISGSDKNGYAVFIGGDGKQSMFKTGEIRVRVGRA